MDWEMEWQTDRQFNSCHTLPQAGANTKSIHEIKFCDINLNVIGIGGDGTDLSS